MKIVSFIACFIVFQTSVLFAVKPSLKIDTQLENVKKLAAQNHAEKFQRYFSNLEELDKRNANVISCHVNLDLQGTELKGNSENLIVFRSYITRHLNPGFQLALEEKRFLENFDSKINSCHFEPVSTWGALQIPKGNGPFPAVIFSHGSGGNGENARDHINFLVGKGVAVFAIDHFKGREIENSIQNQMTLSLEAQVVDAFQAKRLLQTCSLIDPHKIAIGGQSRGGIIADLASRKEYYENLSKGFPLFSAHYAFYPLILSQQKELNISKSPILYLMGEKDNYIDNQITLSYVNRLQRAGIKSEAIVYPKAHHGFDMLMESGYTRFMAQQLNKAAYVYDQKNEENFFQPLNQSKWRPYKELMSHIQSYSKEAQVHVEENDSAREAAKEKVLSFLQSIWKGTYTQKQNFLEKENRKQEGPSEKKEKTQFEKDEEFAYKLQMELENMEDPREKQIKEDEELARKLNEIW